MSMTERGLWESAQCEYVEAMMYILSKVYHGSRVDRLEEDARRVKILRSVKDEPVKPIDVMKCLLPEIEKCAEGISELEEAIKRIYEDDIVSCLSEVANLKRQFRKLR